MVENSRLRPIKVNKEIGKWDKFPWSRTTNMKQSIILNIIEFVDMTSEE